MPEDLDERAIDVQALLDRIPEFGTLELLGADNLRRLDSELEQAAPKCNAVLQRHRQEEPSVGWLFLSIVSTLGSIPATALAPPAIVVTIGGTLSTLKSLHDLNRHSRKEAYYRTLGWQVSQRRAEIRKILSPQN
jgi:hypothetical protein